MASSTQIIADRYEVLESLGNGGFSAVVKVHDRRTGDILALKRLSMRGIGALEVRRFQREFRLLSRLHHPHIVAVKDAGADGDGLYYTMEYLQGFTLDQILKAPDTPFCRELCSGGEALREILVQICEALACIHAQGMVHRDLKPANISIQSGESGPHVKILDLGMAKFKDDGRESLTEEGIMLGTVHYMSPEQIRAVHVDARADLYTLGVILYEILAAQKPFEGRNSAAVILQHLNQIPVPPRVYNLDIPHDLQLIVLKLLEKEPERRYRSAEDLLDDLVGSKKRPLVDQVYKPTLALQARFLGRRAEMADARAMLADIQRNEGRVLALSGSPGIGKTRFLEELMADAHIKGIQILAGACFADRTGPLLPIVEALRAAEKSLGSLSAWVRDDNRAELTRLFSELSADQQDVSDTQPQTDQTTLFQALLQLFEDLAHRAPLMFCLDDIQWADQGTLDFLGFLCQHVDAQSLFLCVTHRPFEAEREPEWLAGVPNLVLTPLDRDSIESLIASVFATIEIPEALVDDIWALSGGNPLCALSIANVLVENEAVVWNSNQWVYRGETDALPEQASAIFNARLDRLPEAGRLPLAYAAVINRPFSFELMFAVVGGDEDALFETMASLVQQNFMSQDAHGNYDVAHRLIADAVCEHLAPDQIEAMHRDVGLGLIELERQDETAGEIARHLLAGGLHREAVPHLIRSGDCALRAYAYMDARTQYAQAWQIVERDETSFAECYPNLLKNYVEALTYIGNWKDVEALAEEGLSKGGLTAPIRGVLLNRLGGAFGIKGAYQEAEQRFLEAFQAGEAFGDQATSFTARMNLINVYWLTGQYAKATEYAESTSRLFQASGDVYHQALGNFLLGNDHLTNSRFAEAETKVFEALDVFENKLKNERYTPICQAMLREVYTYRGRLEEAVALSQQVIESSSKMGKVGFWANETLDLGYVYFFKGEPEKAASHYRAALDVLLDTNQRQKLPLAYTRLAELMLSKGDSQQALKYASDAEDLVGKDPKRRSQVYCALGMCHAALGADEEAAAAFEKSIAVLNESSGLQLALALFESGKFHLSADREAVAKEQIGRARAMFETMGANFFLEKAQDIWHANWEVPRERRERLDMEPLFLDADQDQLLNEAIDRLLQMIQADRGMILTVHDGKPRIQSACSRHLDASSVADISLSVVQAAIEAGTLIVTRDAANDPRFLASQSIADHNIGSILCMPLKARQGHIIGAIYADHEGATDFSTKDIDAFRFFGEFVAVALENALRYHKLQADFEKLAGIRTGFGDMVGTSAPMQSVYDMIERLSTTDVTVLLQGETGTGKGLVARTIHARSTRTDGPFLLQNCGALPSELLESELFGHCKGAFTGASADRQGIFEAADGGTVFLDEIADAPPEVQVRLLHVLEEGMIRRVGENQMRKVNVRVIAATNRDLEAEVQAKRFRQDLYFRLKVVPIAIAPLRERTEDIPLLANHFLDFWCQKMNKQAAGFDPEVQRAFLRYEWPGNIRELENEVQRGVALVENGERISIAHLSESFARLVGAPSSLPAAPAGPLKVEVERFEQDLVLAALKENDWNITHTAEKLGLSRVGFRQKMKKYGIQKPQS